MAQEFENKLLEAEPVAIPFGVNFEENVFTSELTASTNTRSMSDDDTGTYRKDTDDHDT